MLILLCFSLYKDLRDDPMMRRQTKGAEVLEDAVVNGVKQHEGDFELQIRASNSTPEDTPEP